MALQLFLIFLIAFSGSVLQNTIGFGTMIVMMALLPLFLPPQICVAISCVGGAALSWWMLVDLRRSIDWNKILLPTLFGCASVVLGLFFVKTLNDAALLKALGVMLVLLCVWMMGFAQRVHLRANRRNGVIFGLLAGAMSALFAVGAPPLVLYYSATTEDKNNYTACLQITLAIQTTLNLAMRAALGMVPAQAWLLCVPAFLGVVLGKFPGKWIYDKLPLETLKKLIYLFIGILGIYIFFSN